MDIETLKDHLEQFQTRQREYRGHLTILEKQTEEVKDGILKLQGAIEYVSALIAQDSNENVETSVSQNIDSFEEHP